MKNKVSQWPKYKLRQAIINEGIHTLYDLYITINDTRIFLCNHHFGPFNWDDFVKRSI